MTDRRFIIRTALLTATTMVAFAANSVLCRLALAQGHIDAATFSTLRLASGALVLLLLVRVRKSRPAGTNRGDWRSAGLLSLYAIPFSFAYLRLHTGTGALILFGAVQLTMIVSGLRSGERLHAAGWAGFGLAFGGLVYLVLPGLSAPPLGGSLLMAISGIAWGFYSLRGRQAQSAIVSTEENFVRSVPFALLVTALFWWGVHISPTGAMYAILSGAVTSALGYVIWYAALRGLTATGAAIVQLSVPVLAAAGGVAFLSEVVTPRLLLSATAILGGLALYFLKEKRTLKPV